MPEIRKIVTVVEDGLLEGGIPVDPRYRKAAVAVVVTNPYAGRYSEDMSEIVDYSIGLGDIIAERLVSAMDGPIESYGKASLVGMNGETEHGYAFLTTPMANRVRDAIGGGRAWIQSTGKRGSAGTPIDVPLAYKDALMVRSHYDTITVMIGDAPGPDEVLIGFAAASRGRPNFRLGGLHIDDVVGENGMN